MEIKISKASRHCKACEKPFEHGDEVFSRIRYDEEGYAREDFDKEHWSPERAGEAIAVWSTTFHDPKVAEQEPPEVFSPLRQAFYESAESEDRAELAKAYLAAQLLRRQKVFKLIKESDDEDGEARLTLFADRLGNRLIEVRDPNLSYPELEAGRVALLQRLKALESGEQKPESEAVEETVEESNDPEKEK